MALPIAPTPYLMGGDWDDIHRVQREVAAREGRM